MREYTLYWTVSKQPPGGIRVTADIPSSWKETLDGTGAPRFEVPGMDGFEPTIVAIHAPSLDWAIEKQFGAHLAAVERTAKGGGRVWAVHPKSASSVHARMFLPAPHETVVMCVAMIMGGDARWLAKVEPVFETVRVAAS